MVLWCCGVVVLWCCGVEYAVMIFDVVVGVVLWCVVSSEFCICCVVVLLCVVVCCCVVLCGVVWCCVVLCGVVWCCVCLGVDVVSGHTTQPHTTTQRMLVLNMLC